LRTRKRCFNFAWGWFCRHQGNTTQAIENFSASLKNFKAARNSRGKGVTLNNLAHTQIKLGADDEAMSTQHCDQDFS